MTIPADTLILKNMQKKLNTISSKTCYVKPLQSTKDKKLNWHSRKHFHGSWIAYLRYCTGFISKLTLTFFLESIPFFQDFFFQPLISVLFKGGKLVVRLCPE